MFDPSVADNWFPYLFSEKVGRKFWYESTIKDDWRVHVHAFQNQIIDIYAVGFLSSPLSHQSRLDATAKAQGVRTWMNTRGPLNLDYCGILFFETYTH
jgi:hypothetical protein